MLFLKSGNYNLGNWAKFLIYGILCFDILTLGFNICTFWLLVLGFSAKLYDKNSVQIQVNILIKNIVLFLLFKQNSIKKSFRSEADLFYAKIFPIFVSVILTLFHVSYPYFSAQTENVNLANLLNLFCFNLYLFGLLFFFIVVRQIKLDEVG